MKKNNKQLIINCEDLETRVALLNKKRLDEYRLERTDEQAIVGSVYIGRIINLEPSLQAAFVDIGDDKNAFLHYWDMIPAAYDKAEKITKDKSSQLNKKRSSLSQKIRNFLGKKKQKNYLVEIEKKRQQLKSLSINDVPKIFPEGSPILVQVTKGPIGTKGGRLTTNISIPGRYLVLLPNSNHIGLSKKIDNKKERQRLRKILLELDIPEGMGVICRTIAEGRKSIYFKRDLDLLLEHWHNLETKLQKTKIPCVLYQEPTILERTIRDFLTEDIDEIVIDNEKHLRTMRHSLTRVVGKQMAEKVRAHRKASPIFEHFNVEKQIKEIFQREAKLPSGGYLCIDETEALIAVDVNTGQSRKGKDQSETILKTNLEACDEIARQLRLRNIGGLVVLDLIDMRSRKDRDKVFRHLKKLIKQDSAKTRILPISKFGLVEMTRQRENESLKSRVFDPCPYCNGLGKVKSAVSMSVEIQRRLKEVLKRHSREKGLSVRIFMHPSVLARLKNEDADILINLEKQYGQNLSFRADNSLHLEEFKLTDPDTGVEF